MMHFFNNGLFSGENWSYDSGIITYKKKNYSASNVEEFKVNSCNWKWEKGSVDVKFKDGTKIKLQFSGKDQEDVYIVKSLIGYDKLLSNANKNPQNNSSYNSASNEARNRIADALTSDSSPSTSKEKDASVIGRAVAGQIIAGPAGAVVGALSAVDHNNKNKKDN